MVRFVTALEDVWGSPVIDPVVHKKENSEADKSLELSEDSEETKEEQNDPGVPEHGFGVRGGLHYGKIIALI